MSKELIGLVTSDARTPAQRLRRAQMYTVAKAHNIDHPKDAPMTLMVSIIEGAGIDVTRPLPGGDQVMQMVPVEQENGSVKMEAAPIIKAHATEGMDIDYTGLMEQREAENNTLQVENTAMADSLAAITARLDSLATENAELKAQNEALTTAPKSADKVAAAPKKKATVKTKAKSDGEDLT